METDFSGDYLNAENSQQNDIGEVIGEGDYQLFEKNGKTRKVLNIPVRVNGKEKLFAPNRDNGKRLVKAWGKDTKNWLGKKFKCIVVNYKSFGETKQGVEIEPIIAEK